MKANKQDQYTYRVTWSEEDGEHVGLCSEFPGLSWLDTTPEASLRGIRRVVADVVADLEAEKEPVPEPLATRKFSGKILVRIPPEVHRDLVMEASEERVSLNRLVSARLAYPYNPVSRKQRPKAAAG
jgi:predicted HicB family RNase H-like nuclease